MFVCIVSVVDSERERLAITEGRDNVFDEVLSPLNDLTMALGCASVLLLLSSFCRGAHDAKAARCNGKHPCRHSRKPAASGYNDISSMMKRQTSTKPSSCDVEFVREFGTTLLSLKQAWCRASRFVPDTFASAIDLVRRVAHVLTSRGWRLARSVAFSQSPISMYQNSGGRALRTFFPPPFDEEDAVVAVEGDDSLCCTFFDMVTRILKTAREREFQHPLLPLFYIFPQARSLCARVCVPMSFLSL